MSFIHMIMIHNGKICFCVDHWRKIEKIVEQVRQTPECLDLICADFDGGYILLDLDQEIIINNQHCFEVDDKDMVRIV